ncbi:MAG: hypothetical protein TECD_00176 [Hyphomicrobiaceae bacterium hypho_1]
MKICRTQNVSSITASKIKKLNYIEMWAVIAGLAKELLILIVGACFILLNCLCKFTVAGNTAGKRAALVVDANTGETMHFHRADQLLYPASLTKIMTLYLIFEALEDRKLTFNTIIVASKNASSSPPSKIGLSPGHQISVRQAIKALVVKSANDVAVAVAEHMSGSEHKFAVQMTRKARQLGMTKTTFRNASGLPNSNQVTTAYDMSQLALRISDHFPNYYHFFSTRTFYHNGKTYHNHNTLLGRYQGVDGIKTGYIRASGFNLVTSLRDKERSLVAVVMGEETGYNRDYKMRKLLTRYLPLGATVVTRQSHTRYSQYKSLRSNSDIDFTERKFVRSMKSLIYKLKALSYSTQTIKDVNLQSPGYLYGDYIRNKNRINFTCKDYIKAVQGSKMEQIKIQVGAFGTLHDANRQLAKALSKANSCLAGLYSYTSQSKLGKRNIYRARFLGYSSYEAESICSYLKKINIDCFVVGQ